jgi:hypothetical protein
MAWSDPGDFTSGQILTAAQMDSVREAMFFGQATFTNEAARDAAIPATGIALQEGMRAYLTAPTVPDATGTTTFKPTGITTVYNGTAWVCLTPVFAYSATSGTTTSASYVTTLTGDLTAISCTAVTGTTALIRGEITASLAGTATLAVALSVSGATTLAAGATGSLQSLFATTQNGNSFTFPVASLVHGLTAGTNTFTLNYKTNASTATFSYRMLSVQGVA